MMDVTGSEAGRQQSVAVQTGRYLCRVERAVQWTHKTTGSHWLIVDLTVRDDQMRKHPVTLWICWKRKDGTKVRAGCQQISTLAIAAGQEPNAFEESRLKGTYLALILELVQDPGQKPKNELRDAEAVVWTKDQAGRDVPALPPIPEPAPTAGLPPDVDPQSGEPVGDDEDLPF